MQAHALAVEHAFAAAQEKFDTLMTHLASPEALAADHAQIEQTIATDGFELLRLLMQAHLDVRADAEPVREVRGADAQARTHRRSLARQLETIFGTVTVRRLSYGAPGLESLRPLDAELNLPPDHYSAGVRRRVAESAAKESFDEVVASLDATTAAQVPKRQAEQLVARSAVDFEAFYQGRRAATARERNATGSLLVITADGKGVCMRQQDLRPATRKAAQARRHKRQHKLSRGEKRNAKRMATVAAVYTIAPCERTPEQIVRSFHPIREAVSERPRPEHKRVWASLEREPNEVLGEAFEEALRRDPRKQKQWVALVDGNPHQIAILETLADQYQVTLRIVLDIVHVIGYLWRAAAVFHPAESAEAEQWVSDRLLAILQGRSSAVAGGIRRSATLRGLGRDDRKAADDGADYLITYGPYLRYGEALALGAPIATGVIEGACRHLVKDRMEVTGARWSLAGAEAVLKLRSLRSSGDFDDYWAFHQQRELERNHTGVYADGRMPAPVSDDKSAIATPHLRLVRST